MEEVQALTGRALEPDLALRHFASSLLAPGSFLQAALCSALEGVGAETSEAELQGSSTAELQRLTMQVPACELKCKQMFPGCHAHC